MNVQSLDPYALYMLVLAAYVPGLVAIVCVRQLATLCVVTFTFLGMFLFTALGSVLVMTKPHFALGPLVSGDYVAMLVIQALIFYAIVGPYVWMRSDVSLPLSVRQEDEIVRLVLIVAVVAILTAYYVKVGSFLLLDLIAGRISRINILEFRASTYGLPEYPIYRLGFLVFPAIVSAQAVIMASSRGRIFMSDLMVIGVFAMVPLLLADKAGVLNIAVVLLISYCITLGASGKTMAAALNGKAIAAALAAFVPTVVFYFIYFEAESIGIRAVADQILFRVVGVYTEALAATVPFTKENGHLLGATLPNLKGLLLHDRFNLEVAMQDFLAAGTNQVSALSSLRGSSPVPATGEGYVNFGWPGFVLFSGVAFGCVVLIQEVLLRLRMGATSLALMAWYAYLGFTLFTTSLFATFVSLIHTVVAVAVIAAWIAASRFVAARGAAL